MKVLFKFCLLFFLASVFIQCKRDRLYLDTSSVDIKPIEFKRLDKDVFALTESNVSAQMMILEAKYAQFFNRYMSSIVNDGGKRDSLYNRTLLRFVENQDIKTTFKDVLKEYSDNEIEVMGEQMTEIVKRFKLCFPHRKVPKQFVTFMSGFQYNVVYVDSTVGIGLDMYLGSNHPFYSMMQLPKFRTRTMNKSHALSDAVRGWIITEFDNAEPVSNLLNHLLFYGKIFYACNILMPEVQDSVKFGYTSAQMTYCERYENKLWGFFIKDNKLYDNDLKLVSEFTSDGPFTRAISKECPPRIAMWLGRQIVKSYMEHNEGVTMEELMNEKDSQKILAKSKYKP